MPSMTPPPPPHTHTQDYQPHLPWVPWTCHQWPPSPPPPPNRTTSPTFHGFHGHALNDLPPLHTHTHRTTSPTFHGFHGHALNNSPTFPPPPPPHTHTQDYQPHLPWVPWTCPQWGLPTTWPCCQTHGRSSLLAQTWWGVMPGTWVTQQWSQTPTADTGWYTGWNQEQNVRQALNLPIK